MKKLALVLSLPLLLTLTDCKKKGCTTTLDTQVAPDSELVWVNNYLSSFGISAVKHSSGTYYKINDSGTGATPTQCAAIKVNYQGRLTDGSVFDEATNANSPINLTLSNTVYGWRAVLPLLKEGGNMDIYIPPTLAYGSKDYSGIPGNSVLVFNVTLRSVTNP